VTKLFHPLLALIASASDSHLRRQVRYLKEENQILRARIPGQVHTRPDERDRLLKFGLPLGAAIEELISIVTPGTFYRWRDLFLFKFQSGFDIENQADAHWASICTAGD